MIGGGFRGNLPHKPGKGKKNEPQGIIQGGFEAPGVTPETTRRGQIISIPPNTNSPAQPVAVPPESKEKEIIRDVSVTEETDPPASAPTPSPSPSFTANPESTSNSVPKGILSSISARVPNIKTGLGQTHSPVTGPFQGESNLQTAPQTNLEAAKRDLRDGKISVRWNAPLLDGSGYGEAARNYVAALSTVGINVIANAVSFESARSDYGHAGKLSQQAMARVGDYAINIVFTTPDVFPSQRRRGCYNIGLFDWETDLLPQEWTYPCNQMDEIWVPCTWTADVARKSGVIKPIHVFGHCSPPEDYIDGPALKFQEIDPKWFKFYSIFQWTERKNPAGLLRAYLTAFTKKDPVVLILKTYGSDYSEGEQQKIVEEIEKIKKQVGGVNTQPRLIAILGMMTRNQILALHRTGDCFSLIQRSEGWGLPHLEACMMGKPVITTNFGATLEFTKPNNSYVVDYSLTQVFGMKTKYYTSNMKWAEPNIAHCSKLMRHVFSKRDEARERAVLAKSFVERNFSWEVIGNRIKNRLSEIAKSI